MSHTEDWVALALLVRPQGRKGELLAELLTDFPERFALHPNVSLLKQDGSTRPAVVESHWLPMGKNAGRVVLKFQGVDSINDAELLNGMEVVVPIEQRMPLDEGSEYVSDLVGCTLWDDATEVGVVEDVHFPTDAAGGRLEEAAPLLVVRSLKGDELLIPYAKSWIKQVDVKQKRIEMTLPDGLLEING